MKRSKKVVSFVLLAVYLPILLLASFHTHQHENCCECPTEHTSSSHDMEDDGCLLCQFLQTPYEQALIISSPAILIETVAFESEPAGEVIPVFTYSFSSRAPPVLL